MIDSGNDAGHHQPPLNIPPSLDIPSLDIPSLDIATIYSWVTMQGSKYRDFSSSRQEARARFRQRFLLKQRVETARKARAQAASTQMAVQDPVQAPDPSPNSQPIPESTEVRTQEGTPESVQDPVIQAPPAIRESVVEHAQDEEETLPSVPGQYEDEKPEVETGSGTHEPDASLDQGTPRAPAATDALRRGKAGLGSRWFALRSVFAGDAGTRTGAGAPRRPVPVVAIFSQAGGVGKTSLAATLGRVLAARGEQAFLAETASPGLLPLYFGSREVKPGVVRTFSPPSGSEDAAVRAVTLDPRQFLEKRDAPDLLAEALLRYARGSDRILIDIQTGSKTVAHRLLPQVSVVLVPLLADMNSVMSLNAVEEVFANQEGANRGEPGGYAIEPVYLLNQFDGTLPLHVEVRELLQKQLGGRLLPFVVRRSAAVSEALAEGMTVVDYAPDSSVVEDYVHLADWLASAAPAAVPGFSGLRWSER